jgi:hypothetical protein
VLSGKVTASSVWMLHSPLACTANAGRILRIWAPRLTGDSTRVDRRQEWAAALGQRLKTQVRKQEPPGTHWRQGAHSRIMLDSRSCCTCAWHVPDRAWSVVPRYCFTRAGAAPAR